jgi:hypothetical protein
LVNWAVVCVLYMYALLSTGLWKKNTSFWRN